MSLTLPGKTVTKAQVKVWLLRHRVITSSGCWEWRVIGGYRNLSTRPYRRRPSTKIQGTRYWVTHLAAWAWLEFDLEDHAGLQVNHHCDNYRCFSPKKDHMYIGTQAENIADMHRRGRWQSKNPRRGTEAAGAKLSERDVLKILQLRKDQGLVYREIGEIMGIGTVEVWRICNGKRWAWLTVDYMEGE